MHIFRAVGLILQNIEDENYKACQTVYFDETCVMMDVSQGNALPKLDKIFFTLRMLAAMGINTFMIYVEECYEIKGEDYFGYMRPKYTYEHAIIGTSGENLVKSRVSELVPISFSGRGKHIFI